MKRTVSSSSKRSLLLLLILIFITGMATSSSAAVTAKEAERLKQDLTPLGAERKGNADGTIPAWDGGLKSPPAGWKKNAEGTNYINPFPEDKILFKITAQNMDQYADKLTEGVKAMLKRHPDTYYLPVYKTHRTFALPQFAYDNTFKAATKITLNDDGLNFDPKGINAAFPFPIPQNVTEVVFNSSFRYIQSTNIIIKQTLVTNGVPSENGTNNQYQCVKWWDPEFKYKSWSRNEPLMYNLSAFFEPPRRKGEYSLATIMNNFEDQLQAWAYVPGARRVRRAPNFAHDGMNPAFGGLVFFDEGQGFESSNLDRYNLKLLGKKEIYIPYNNYDLLNATDAEVIGKNTLNPALMRWELHRVWMVEATLKEGFRHQLPRRVVCYDEDSWVCMLHDGYDANGKLWHHSQYAKAQLYDFPCATDVLTVHNDMQKNRYGLYHNNAAQNLQWTGTKGATHQEEFFQVENLRRLGRR